MALFSLGLLHIALLGLPRLAVLLLQLPTVRLCRLASTRAASRPILTPPRAVDCVRRYRYVSAMASNRACGLISPTSWSSIAEIGRSVAEEFTI